MYLVSATASPVKDQGQTSKSIPRFSVNSQLNVKPLHDSSMFLYGYLEHKYTGQ